MSNQDDPPELDVVVHNIGEASARTMTEWQASGHRVLRLEGFAGAGKTSIAGELKELCPRAVIISVDEFEEGDGPYKSHTCRVNLNRLRTAAQAAIDSGTWVIFDGVCLETLLPSMQFSRGYRVYVKCLRPIWHEGSYLFSGQKAADPLLQEIIEYHEKQRPHLASDLVIAILDET